MDSWKLLLLCILLNKLGGRYRYLLLRSKGHDFHISDKWITVCQLHRPVNQQCTGELGI